MPVRTPIFILPVIVVSQFCCTSLWFASNGVLSDLITTFHLSDTALGHLTSAVQFGFIIGTLIFSIFSVADRLPPSKVFLYCAILGALANVFLIHQNNDILSLLLLRFLTGFFLAGIYPVGMKIAADYYEKGLGKSLGLLVGALVIGTALPHLLKAYSTDLPWKTVIIFISILASCGGLLMWLLVKDGPFRKSGSRPDFSSIARIFKDHKFRSAALGYFGHMWELYAFWAFVPLMLLQFDVRFHNIGINVPMFSFFIIGFGAIACIVGSHLAEHFGTKKIAYAALVCSGGCCILSPLILLYGSPLIFIIFLFIWSAVVIADSPLFSTLVAQNAAPEIKATAITLVTCIGFAITIMSIQGLTFLHHTIDFQYIFLFLAIGPIASFISLRMERHRNAV